MNKEVLYKRLISAYSDAYKDKLNGKEIQNEVSKLWKEMKKNDNLEELVKAKMAEWKNIAMQKKSKLLSMWSKVRIEYYVKV